MTTTLSPDAPTEPSKEALEIAWSIAQQPLGMLVPGRALAEQIALALDRFRAAGVRKAVERFIRRVETSLIYIDRPYSPSAQSIREGLEELKRELGIRTERWPPRVNMEPPHD